MGSVIQFDNKEGGHGVALDNNEVDALHGNRVEVLSKCRCAAFYGDQISKVNLGQELTVTWYAAFKDSKEAAFGVSEDRNRNVR